MMNRPHSPYGPYPPPGAIPWNGKKSNCGKKPSGGHDWNQGKVLGLSLLIIGGTVLCAVILPSAICLVCLGGAMIYCGYKLFKG